MQFMMDTLDAIGRGDVTVAFRRWKRPTVRLGGTLTTRVGVLSIDALDAIEPDDITSVGLSLGVFKAAQLLEVDDFGAAFASFTAVDIETTDRDVTMSEIVEIAAVRVTCDQAEAAMRQTIDAIAHGGWPIAVFVAPGGSAAPTSPTSDQ